MGGYFAIIDQFAIALARAMIRWRWGVLGFGLLLAAMAGSGGARLDFDNNYRAFFSKVNPELQNFERLQATYTKNDNILFVIVPREGEVFTPRVLSAIEALTEEAWKTPFAIRVDSIANFQYTYGVEDDLIVEDLVRNAAQLTADDIAEKRSIALNEPLLRDLLLTPDAHATAINVVLQYPEKALTEVPEAVAFARALRDRIEQDFPEVKISLSGISMLNNAFFESGFTDFTTLVPLMFAVILLLTWVTLRTLWGTLATLSVIILSTIIAMGLAGYAGIKLTPVAASAPIIILTLAIADSIHILASLRTELRDGLARDAAIIEAVRLNFLPVTITSLTTVVGFLALNFSDSPPFWHLGNITAMGIAAAWIYSLTLLPALMRILPYRVKMREDSDAGQRRMGIFADWVIRYFRPLLLASSLLALGLALFIPKIEFNDQWVEYFDQRIEFRRESVEALKYFGMYPVEFSITAADSGGISDPQYLHYLEEFAQFLRQQDHVIHVYSLSDIMKRLNKNLHGDDPNFYRIPDDRELSAQYLLLYELSLPYGLDLNDRLNLDKSASRLTVTMDNATTAETKAFLASVNQWQSENLPEYMRARPTSPHVMFTYITDRNVINMISGTVLAILLIAVIMMLTLRSFGLGLLSLLPNTMPLLATFGAWAILVGEVGFSVATVASISLGIIVDDTVHLLAKYVRARRERGLSAEDSIRYAFRSVGMAVIYNTIILAIGFVVLTTSSFKVNVDMGLLTAIAIVFALLLDFLFLPGLLLLAAGKERKHTPSISASQA